MSKSVLSALLLIIMISCALYLIKVGASWAVVVILLFGGYLWAR